MLISEKQIQMLLLLLHDAIVIPDSFKNIGALISANLIEEIVNQQSRDLKDITDKEQST